MATGKTTTRSTAKKAEELRISQINDFKTRMGGIMQLPSGLTVKTRNPGGLQAFMAGGEIPNNLMPIVQEALEKGKQMDMSSKFIHDGKIDAGLYESMETMMNNMVVKVVVEPKIHPILTEADVKEWNQKHPDNQVTDPEELRSDEKLYADEIPLDDKMFLFQWVSGGTRDLEKFRQQLEEGVASVATKSSDVSNAQQRAGLDPR